MVRAGDDQVLAEEIETKGAVAVGWPVGDLSDAPQRAIIKDRLMALEDEIGAKAIPSATGQLHRFVNVISTGDDVVTFLRSTREYLVGKVSSKYRYDPTIFGDEYPHVRIVTWEGRVPRDLLSEGARNSLGSTLTLFDVADHIDEMRRLAVHPEQPVPADEFDEEQPPFHEDVESRANQFIGDVLDRMSGSEFEDLVASLLRAMGYAVQKSPPGADGGIDIRAAPDRLLLSDPMIRVQVKHRSQPMGSSEVQKLVGSLGPGTRGLFVSTGGFTRDAKREADRANQPVTLVDLDEFLKLLKDHYDALAIEVRDLVPMKRIWVPLKT